MNDCISAYSMTKWEYRVVDCNHIDERLEEKLNLLGQRGWEVVAGGTGGYAQGAYKSQFVLKRPL